MTDIPADTTTTAHIDIGGSFTGSIETNNDHDWIEVDLVAGQKYTFTLDGYGSNALVDPYLTLFDSTGTSVAENDDGDGNRNSRIVFTATNSGTYYLDAASWTDGTTVYTGDYQLTAKLYTPPPVYTYDQISDQLVNGYWGGDWHHFNVTQGGTITVNITGLTAAGQTLARAALQEWSDVIGVTFKEVTGTTNGVPNGQIVFDDSDTGAYTSSDWSDHVITTSNVNISTQWLSDYGTSLDSYSFQTYVHEIGHALGLGHGGNYNNTASYPDDALYANDAWSTTVMSYFSQHDSSYFNNQGFTEDYVLTPMTADILAMQTLYGLSTTTRTGNTIYGYGSNSGNPVFNTTQNPHAAYTIVDSGGTDTLNYASTAADQLINLNPETFSNVAGDIGNVSIAVGTVIENANGGSGDDVIVGNQANNVLNGNGGNDTVSYEAATAGVTVNLGLTTAQNTIGAGTDTLTNFESLIGSAFDDTLTGSTTTQSIHGGDGNDRITATGTGGTYSGDAGDDTYIVSSTSNILLENANQGIDSVRSSVSFTLGANFENLILTGSSNLTGTGNELDNQITGNTGADTLYGNAGNDTLDGGTGVDQMYGGTGDDTYIVSDARDGVFENAGEGTDTVRASVTYALTDNVENLVLIGSAALNGTGNALANVITGNSAANILSGGDGNDQLIGGGGDDFLYGNAGNDSFDGGAGVDKMFGGAGDDTYTIRDATDYAYELPGEGTDTALAAISYALRDNVENLTLTGTGNITGKGNSGDNIITGNSGANGLYGNDGVDHLYGNAGNDVLDGGAGADVLAGGTGNDTYAVDNANDLVIENVGEGTDRVNASVNYTLTANVEMLSLVGNAIVGTGNALDNNIGGNDADNVLYGMAGNDRLFGQGGNDVLDGGTGADSMRGGTGDDTYYIDNVHDSAVEYANEGTDLVISSVKTTLRANVENLTMVGTDDINGTGNDEDNVMTGNSGANVFYGLGGNDHLYGMGGADNLRGGDGNDWIDGGADRDVMVGGTGADTFVFHDGDFAGVTVSTCDQIVDFSQSDGDQIRLDYVDADTTASGNQAFAFLGTAAFDGTAGELRYEQISGNTYVEGDTNGDGTADFMIRLDGLHTLASTDFVL